MERQRKDGEDLALAAERLAGDLAGLRRAIGERAASLRRQLRERVRHHPVAAVGGAFAVGYLLGGGVCSRSTARLMLLGVRWAGAALVRPLLLSLVLGEDRGVPAEDPVPMESPAR